MQVYESYLSVVFIMLLIVLRCFFTDHTLRSHKERSSRLAFFNLSFPVVLLFLPTLRGAAHTDDPPVYPSCFPCLVIVTMSLGGYNWNIKFLTCLHVMANKDFWIWIWIFHFNPNINLNHAMYLQCIGPTGCCILLNWVSHCVTCPSGRIEPHVSHEWSKNTNTYYLHMQYKLVQHYFSSPLIK